MLEFVEKAGLALMDKWDAAAAAYGSTAALATLMGVLMLTVYYAFGSLHLVLDVCQFPRSLFKQKIQKDRQFTSSVRWGRCDNLKRWCCRRTTW